MLRHRHRAIVTCQVGDVGVLETHDIAMSRERPVIVRTLNSDRAAHDLRLRVSNEGAAVGMRGGAPGWLRVEGGFVTLTIPADATPLRLAVESMKHRGRWRQRICCAMAGSCGSAFPI